MDQEEIERRLKNLEEENKKLKKLIKEQEPPSRGKKSSGEVSRRGFLKKLGMGAISIGALGLSSAASIKITKDGFNHGGNSILDFKNDNILKTDLDLQGTSSIKNAQSVSTNSLVVNSKLYEHDGTINETGSEITYNVNGNYEEMVLISSRNVLGLNALRVNGDTGTNYSYTDLAGNQTTGDSYWRIPTADRRGPLIIRAARNIGIGINVRPTAANTGYTVAGFNSNVDGPISQFTLVQVNNNSYNEKIEVYGRSI